MRKIALFAAASAAALTLAACSEATQDAAEATGCKVFHAGTAEQDGQVVTSGGRVLCVTALGDSVAAATERAYEGVDAISWQDMLVRRDIAWRAIARERGDS